MEQRRRQHAQLRKPARPDLADELDADAQLRL
jgi:hypothetical protein